MMWSAFALVFVGFLNSCSAQEQTSVKESTLTFELNGINHHESRRVQGNIVTLIDTEDGFLTVLDYNRGIFMVQNTTTQRCYFATLENIPINIDEEQPIFAKEIEDESELKKLGAETDVALFRPVGTIPESYVRVTNDVGVVQRCSSQPAYWLETKRRPISRERRAKCIFSCPAFIVGFAVGWLSG